MKGFSWDSVRLLLALFRTTNAEEAATSLGVDRSTISRRLATLEEDLGQRLFARTRDGLRPTPAGLRLRPLAETMESAAIALGSAATALDERVQGAVRVATTEALASLLVTEGLLTLNDQHPNIAIELLSGNKPLDVARGQVDIALRVSAVREPSLRVRCVARNGIGLFASPSYLRARDPITSRATLRGHDVLLPTGELARLPESRWLSTRSGVRVVFRSNSMPSLVAAAMAGRGIVPLGLSWERQPGLTKVLVLEEIPKRPMWLVTRADDGARAAVQLVSDRISTILARIFGGG